MCNIACPLLTKWWTAETEMDRKEYHRKWRELNKESIAKRRKSKSYRERQIIANKKWLKKNPDKLKAQRRVQDAIRHGKIKRGICRDCGSSNTQGHHKDYSKYLEVIWLCPLHHAREHIKLKTL